MADFLCNFTDDSAYVLQVTGIDKNKLKDLVKSLSGEEI